MENLIELWYLNNVAFIATVITIVVFGYIWYDSGQKDISATNWMGVGLLSLGLTLLASWTTLNFGDNEVKVLQTYFERIASGQIVLGENTQNELEKIAIENPEISEPVNLDYGDMEMFLYLSIAGIIGSVIAGGGYYRSAQDAGSYTVASPYPATYQLPSTEQQYDPPPPMTPPPTVAPPITTADIPKSGSPPLDRTRQMNEPSRAVAWLVMRDGPRKGKGYPLDSGETLIGRDGQRCQIVLDHESISGQHAKVRTEHGAFWLHDLASTNGTYLNKQRIQRQRLEDGDEVHFGALKFVFKEVQ